LLSVDNAKQTFKLSDVNIFEISNINKIDCLGVA